METARVARAEILSLRAREFVIAARAAGAGFPRLLTRHLLRNAAGPLLVAVTLAVGRSILLESALSFFGVGVQPPAASWGNMLYQAQTTMSTEPWLAVFPGCSSSRPCSRSTRSATRSPSAISAGPRRSVVLVALWDVGVDRCARLAYIQCRYMARSTQIARWGNSLGVRLPRSVALEARVDEGDRVDVSVRNGAIVLRPSRPAYSLDQLVAKITPRNRHGESDWGATVGDEAW